jgi:flagellar biogenesis protein FliO
MYIQIILNLVLVLGLIVVYMFVTWKLKGIKNSKNQLIEVISTLGIGAKEKILLLKVDGKKILIGATAQNITVLANLETQDRYRIEGELSDSFSDSLQKVTIESHNEREVQ